MASRAEVMENSGRADLKYYRMEDPAQPLSATKAFEYHLGQAWDEDRTPHLLSQASALLSLALGGPNGPDMTKVPHKAQLSSTGYSSIAH